MTFYIVTASGGTAKGGGDLKITDMWRLNSDDEQQVEAPSWAASSLEMRKEFIAKQKKQNDSIRDNSKGR